MKLSLMQIDLQKALHVVASVVPSKSTLPILETVLMNATSDGKLTFTATDLDISVKTEKSATVTQEGSVAVSARRLFEVVRELPDQEISLTGTENHLSLKCSRGHYRFVGAPIVDFPDLPDIPQEKQISLETDSLEKMIKRTLYSVSTDETRPELTGVYIEIGESNMRMVATNGHRLSRSGVVGTFKQSRQMLLPPKALNQLLRQIPNYDGKIEVNGNKSYVRFRVGQTELYSRLLEGPFPDYERVIPKSSSFSAIINRADFISSLRRILVLSDSQTRQVKMVFEPNRLQVLAEYQGAGEAAEEMPIEYDGDEMMIGFNGGYLLEMMKTFDVDTVEMKFESAVSAGVFHPVDGAPEEEMLCLIMPLRLPEEG